MKKQSIKQATTKHEFNSAMIGIILFDGTMQNDHILYIRHGGKQLEYVDEKIVCLCGFLLIYIRLFFYPSLTPNIRHPYT